MTDACNVSEAFATQRSVLRMGSWPYLERKKWPGRLTAGCPYLGTVVDGCGAGWLWKGAVHFNGLSWGNGVHTYTITHICTSTYRGLIKKMPSDSQSIDVFDSAVLIPPKNFNKLLGPVFSRHHWTCRQCIDNIIWLPGGVVSACFYQRCSRSDLKCCCPCPFFNYWILKLPCLTCYCTDAPKCVSGYEFAGQEQDWSKTLNIWKKSKMTRQNRSETYCTGQQGFDFHLFSAHNIYAFFLSMGF